MINYESILSAFDGKPTLLQWLKLVKKALDESVLKDITLKQDGANAIFTFNFEDGTSISTPAVTLPKGDTGAKGDKGDKGEQGVSVTGVDEVSNEVVGSQTLTTLRFNFSNGTNNEVVVHAENGKSGGKLYKHELSVRDESNSSFIIFVCYSTQKTYINNYDSFVQAVQKKFFEPLVSARLNNKKVIGTYRYDIPSENTYTIRVDGFTSDNTSVAFEESNMTVNASERFSYTDKVTEL